MPDMLAMFISLKIHFKKVVVSVTWIWEAEKQEFEFPNLLVTR